MSLRGCVLVGMLAVGGCAMGGCALGQQSGANALTAMPTSTGGVLRGLAARAGVVFVGQVHSIVPKEGVVEITFLVQQPVAGVVAGTYVMREWAGRWTGGQQRYRLGQRAMFFLYAPNAGGLSSSVGGMAGVVPLIPMGADADALLDVRMLAARVSRRMGSSPADAGFGAVSLHEAKTAVRNWRLEDQPELMKRLLPEGVRGRESLGVDRTDVPSLLQPGEQTDAQR
jgi:hypothetical protein